MTATLASLAGCATSTSGSASKPEAQQERRASVVERLRQRIAALEAKADAMHGEAKGSVNDDALTDIRREIAALKAKLAVLEAATDDRAGEVKEGIQQALRDLEAALEKLKEKI